MMQATRQKLLIATNNAGKVVEIRHELEKARLMDLEVLQLVDIGPHYECIEDRTTFIGNATKKARYYAGIANCLTLADDSGLCVEALGGAPGVISARWSGVEGDRHAVDAANNAKLVRELEGVPDGKRQAKFVCAMALSTPLADLAVMVDDVCGEILRQPRGEGGFGYDPYFYFPQYKKTTAELTTAEKSFVSHRGKALRRMIAWMRENREKLKMLGGAG